MTLTNLFLLLLGLSALSVVSTERLKRQNTIQENCALALILDSCTSGAYEDVSYLISLCTQVEDALSTARMLQGYCRTDSNGVYCANFLANIDPLRETCNAFIHTCDPECRDVLASTCPSGCSEALTSVRAEIGCCGRVFNEIGFPELNYDLWALCGVEPWPDTDLCGPSTFELPARNLSHPLCLQSDLQGSVQFNVICKAEFLDSQRNALLATEGCESSVSILDVQTAASCAVNEGGSYCDSISNLLSEHLTTASSNCMNTSVCDPLCIDTLEIITRSVGCCFITVFNSSTDPTDPAREYLSYEFWQRCNLTSPGFCGVRLNNSTSRISASTAAAPNAAILAAVLLAVGTYRAFY